MVWEGGTTPPETREVKRKKEISQRKKILRKKKEENSKNYEKSGAFLNKWLICSTDSETKIEKVSQHNNSRLTNLKTKLGLFSGNEDDSNEKKRKKKCESNVQKKIALFDKEEQTGPKAKVRKIKDDGSWIGTRIGCDNFDVHTKENIRQEGRKRTVYLDVKDDEDDSRDILELCAGKGDNSEAVGLGKKGFRDENWVLDRREKES